MGVYLSSPITDKESIVGKSSGYVYGASSMQGWRITQEDAHNCIPDFNEKSKTSFFAVYDGHGGSEVAKYCERHFPDFVKQMLDTCESAEDFSKLIQQSFLAFDATLTNEDVIKELKELAGKDDEADEEEEEDPVGRTETERLKEEANMPIDQLLAQYKTADGKPDSKAQFQSPALRGKIPRDKGENGESSLSLQQEEDDQPSSSKSLEESPPESSAVSQGTAAASSSSSSSSSQPAASSSSISNGKSDGGAASSSEAAQAGGSNNASSGNKNNNNLEKPAGSSGSKEGSSSSDPDVGGSGSSNSRASKDRAVAGMAATTAESSDDDDDEEEEEEEMWEDDSEEDDDDEEEEDEDVPMMDMTNEEPGSDSGCTACVLLMQDKKLIVANSGDSRCVLARGGKAVDLSFDHKPEDKPERDRIEKAGGKVTADGRVNGGLNLSRAIGDHVYKRNNDLPARDQMITALPDIESTELGDEDQFLVIACDGIWNYMSSQEVVDYVMVKLKDPEKRDNPSRICEELFENCLAPNTFGDGTGCDNMTCIIIVLDTFAPTEPATPGVKAIEQEAKDSTETHILKDFPHPDSSSDQSDVIGTISSSSAGEGVSDDASLSSEATRSLKRCADDMEGVDEKRTKREEEVV